MLVLTRKPGQSILIDDEAEITLVEVRGDKVCLRISVPTRIPQNREVLLSPDESVSIDDDIEVMVVGIWDYSVRLGITAPQEVGIRREEA